MERKIDFFIIGAQKAGTTSLYHHLARHPDIFMPDVKENHFFVRDEFYRQGERYLDAIYRDLGAERLVGGADVDLLYFTDAARRLHDYNPRMKLVAVLRNPIDRAHSAYWYARRNGSEDCESFQQALQRPGSGWATSRRDRVELTYLEHGHYAEQLAVYMELFGRRAVHVLLTEELASSLSTALSELLAWLSLPTEPSQLDLDGGRANVAGMPRSPWFHRLLRSSDRPLKRAARRVLPARLRLGMRKHVIRPLMRWNIRPARYPSMDPGTRAWLREYYRPYNDELAQLLGRDLSDWDR